MYFITWQLKVMVIDMTTRFLPTSHQFGRQNYLTQLLNRRGMQPTMNVSQMPPGQEFLDPYFRSGEKQIPFLEDVVSRYSDPKNLYSSILEDYETSPEATREIQDLTEAGLDMAYATGTGGSVSRADLMRRAGEIRQRDRRNYLMDILGIENQGIGVAQGLYGGGLQSGGQMGQMEFSRAQQDRDRQFQREMEQRRMDEIKKQQRRNMLATAIGVGGGLLSNALF